MEMDEKKYELICGRSYQKRPPKRWHQKLVNELCEEIEEYREGQPGVCEVFTAPFAVYLFRDSDTCVLPDITVIFDREKVKENSCYGAPELVMEVVEPETQNVDYRIKLAKYKEAGVKEYWIIDRDWRYGYVYYFDDGEMELSNFSGKISSRICGGLVIDFSKLG